MKNKTAPKKTHWLRNTIAVLLACAIVGGIWSLISFKRENSRVSVSASIQFTFKEAAQGKTPNGYSFDVAARVASDEIVGEALQAAGLDGQYTAEQIQRSLVIRGSYPENLIEELNRFDSLLDFSSPRVQTLSNYYPMTYGVTLYNDFDPSVSRDQMESLLGNLLTVYRAWFEKTGIYGQVTVDLLEGLDDYDYTQQLDLLELSLDAFAAYAESMHNLNPAFRLEGKSFSDVQKTFESLRDNDLNRLKGRVTLNVLSKDSRRLETQYLYKISELENKLAAQKQKQSNLDEVVKTYGKSGVIYLSTMSNVEQVDHQSTATYDALVSQRTAVSETIASIQAQITDYRNRLAELYKKTGSAETAAIAAAVEAAEAENETGTAADEGSAETVALTEADDTAAQIASLESGITRLRTKIHAATEEMNQLLTAYNGQEASDNEILLTKVRYTQTKIISSAFAIKFIRTAGPLCAVGFIVCMVLLIVDRIREEKRKKAA